MAQKKGFLSEDKKKMEQMSKDGRLYFLSFASMALFSLQVELEFRGGFLFSDFFFFYLLQ